MILLQLITGRPPIRREIGNLCYLIPWVRSKFECGDIHGIIDPRLGGEFHVPSAWKIVEIAMSCIVPDSKERPDIVILFQELNECLYLEMNHAKSNSLSSYPSNRNAQFDSVTSPSAR